MKKWIFILALAIVSLSTFSQTRRGDSSFGLNVGYGFDTDNATFGVDYRYNVTDEFRLAPSISYYAKNNNLSTCALDLNAHYVFKLSDMFGFYPLGGVDLSFWKRDYLLNKDTATRLGLNIGMGGEVYATKDITVGMETKYNTVEDWDQAYLTVRVGYNF